MFSTAFRWVLPVVGVIAALASFAGGRPAFGAAYLGATVLFAIGALKFPSISPALDDFRRGDMARVRERLDRIRAPGRLGPRQRAYYDWMRGILAADDGDLAGARALLQRAGEGPLRSENDRAILDYQLAGVALRQGDVAAARAALAAARGRNPPPEMLARIDELERELPGG